MWSVLIFNVIYNFIILFKVIYCRFTFIFIILYFLKVFLNSLLSDNYYCYNNNINFLFLSYYILFK